MHRFSVLLALALSVPGCSTYLAGYDYVPKPADVGLVAGSRVLVSVAGVRRAEDGVRSEAVEVQMQVEHAGPGTLVLEPAGLTLTGGNLVRLETAQTEPAAGVRVGPGGDARLTAYFTLPGRGGGATADLDGLNLQITAELDGEAVTRSATFTERANEPNGGRVRFGVGIGL